MILIKTFEITIHRHSTDAKETKTVKAENEKQALQKLLEAMIGSYIVLGIKESK